MIKSIVSFVKNLFGSKEPQQLEQQAPAWPFPTTVPEDGPVQETVPAVIEDLPVEPAVSASTTAPKKRKRRTLKKTTAAPPAAAVAAPVEAVKETTKLSPGSSRRRKAKK